jgi:hypothetical protein
MLFNNIPAKLIACASLAFALPRSDTDVEKRYTEHQILKALAGTYSLVNTTRYQ